MRGKYVGRNQDKQEAETGSQSNNQHTINLRRKKPTVFMKQEQRAIKSKKKKKKGV